ncbi:MAG: hypothetical protein HQ541_17165 [Mariniphaga sp.]|nr:hypothetical protein [Mariniphaga sp.]
MTTKTQFNKNPIKPLISSVADKEVIWLPNINKYIVVNSPIEKIVKQIYRGKSDKQVINYCINKLGFSPDESSQILHVTKNNLKRLQTNKNVLNNENSFQLKIHSATFNNKRYYRINDLIFFIEYEIAEIEYLIHPKFAHLEIKNTGQFDNHFQLFKVDSEIALVVNGKFSGSWSLDKEHFMTGKVSMEILQKIYKKEEEEWMAVFHAAGISNGKKGILFLGDSGNGKSTLSALLMSSGFEVLADDFLPVESDTSQLCFFPAAISVKKHAIDLLIPTFPELKHAKEYLYPAFNKTVRYLSNSDSAKGKPKKVQCKALVFVKYDSKAELQFSSLPKDIAFQKLVPDSWISPFEKNAKLFLDWFGRLPCYQLTYSNNETMVETVKNIFEDEV